VSHWLIEALEQGLRDTPTDQLQEAAGRHLLAKDEFRTEGGGEHKRISPTLMASECRLQRLKRYRGHGPLPGVTARNYRQGQPSATSSMHFLRGYLNEGMAAAALSSVGAEYGFEVLGVSPVMKFECTVRLGQAEGWPVASFLAYPDMVIVHDGEIELVQLKCPSVFAVQRYRRNGGTDLRRRYEPQAIAEMFCGIQIGLPIVRNHILASSFEGFLPSSEEARSGLEVNAVVETVEWDPSGMEQWVLSVAQEILEDDRNADRGQWVPAYPAETADKWPCSYCGHVRVPMNGATATCEENHLWELEPNPAPSLNPSSPPASSATVLQ
jgi:hypothetical protein